MPYMDYRTGQQFNDVGLRDPYTAPATPIPGVSGAQSSNPWVQSQITQGLPQVALSGLSKAQDLSNQTSLANTSGDIASRAAAQKAQYEKDLASQNQAFQSSMSDKNAAHTSDQARQQEQLQQQLDSSRANLVNQQNQSRQAAIQGLLSSGGGGSVGGGAGGSVGAPPSAQSVIDSENASFARAKDRIAQTNSAKMNDIKETMANRGLSGSSIEGNQLAGSLDQSAGQLGDFSRQQAVTGLETALGLRQQDLTASANANQQALTKRAQDLSAIQSAFPNQPLF